jgi:hypothetical protein
MGKPSFTPHCGLKNDSGRIRWSIELRFQRSGTPTGRTPASPFRALNLRHLRVRTTDLLLTTRLEFSVALLESWEERC